MNETERRVVVTEEVLRPEPDLHLLALALVAVANELADKERAVDSVAERPTQ